MTLQLLPEDGCLVAGFDIKELNQMILDQAPKVFRFWSELVKLDYVSGRKENPALELSPIRIDDLELLYFYSQQCYMNQDMYLIIKSNQYRNQHH